MDVCQYARAGRYLREGGEGGWGVVGEWLGGRDKVEGSVADGERWVDGDCRGEVPLC